jgi:hypothetical protein
LFRSCVFIIEPPYDSYVRYLDVTLGLGRWLLSAEDGGVPRSKRVEACRLHPKIVG